MLDPLNIVANGMLHVAVVPMLAVWLVLLDMVTEDLAVYEAVKGALFLSQLYLNWRLLHSRFQSEVQRYDVSASFH